MNKPIRKVLVFGGTGFLGRQPVREWKDELVEAGHPERPDAVRRP